MQESLNLLQAPLQIILHPLSTVENIYGSLKMLPHLPEIIEKKLVEFSKLSEEEQCRAVTRGVVSAGFFLVGSPVKAAISKNVNLAMGKMIKATGASKVLEQGEKILRSGVERLGGKVGNLEEIAKKLNVKVNNQVGVVLCNNRHMKVSEFISKHRKGAILNEFPGEFLNMSIEEALISKNRTVKKLLCDGRFAK